MSIEKIKEALELCKRPLDFFGDVSLEEISKKYRKYARYCHPDLVTGSQKELAEETIKILNQLYEEAEKEYREGTYNITDQKELYKKIKPIIEFDLGGKNYKFYRDLGCGDVGNIYEGLFNDELVCLKVVMDEADNNLIKNEYELLRNLNHQSLPRVKAMLKINGKNSLIYEKSNGYSLEEIIKEYGRMPGEHVSWILERMLSLIGYLHSNMIIHGNIKPENIVINPDTHNVYIEDYSLAIKDANKDEKKYMIINEFYTPNYVDKNALITPNVDIYGVGKIAVLLLGGDIRNNAMPIDCELKIRTFIRKLVDEKIKPNDAWELWDELISLRNEIYGTKRFQKLEKKL